MSDYEALEPVGLREALEHIVDTFNRDNIRPGQAAFLMFEIAQRALDELDERIGEPPDPAIWAGLPATRGKGTP